MIIRPVEPSDSREKISEIYEKSWRFAYKDIIPQSYLDGIPKGSWAGRLDLDGKISLVAEDDGTFAGTVCYCPSRFEFLCGMGEIVSIYLIPEYIGRGVGRELMTAAVNGLTELGFCNIFLWVLEENSRARCFYERFGFKAENKYTDTVIGGKALREVLYTLKR